MAGAWNEGDWGLGNFGQQNNVTVPVTSVVDTPLAWNVGNFGANNWGGQFDNIGITLGNETTAGEINEGWGRLTWGENAWGGTGDVIVLGNQINISTGTVTFKIDSLPSVTGLQLNTSLDSVQAFGLAIVEVTGQQLNISEGTADASPDALVTGQQLNISSLGNVTVTAEINSGWGRLTWGQNDWNSDGISQIIQVSNTGLGLNVNSGIREYWGQDAWGASTTEWGGSYVTETIISATVEVSSIAMTISEGEVDPGPDANVVGIGMTVGLAIGTVVIGTGNVTLTGQQLNIAQGTAIGDANTIASVTGIGLNIAVGTVFAGGNSVIEVTGNALTITLNSINNQIWTEINTGTDATWIEIDTAA